MYSKSGERLERLAADFVGTLAISAKEDQSWFFVSGTGFTTPSTIFRYDYKAPEGQRWSTYRDTKLNGLNPNDFVAEQVNFIENQVVIALIFIGLVQ